MPHQSKLILQIFYIFAQLRTAFLKELYIALVNYTGVLIEARQNWRARSDNVDQPEYSGKAEGIKAYLLAWVFTFPKNTG
jgi:hypothetical protein